MADEVWARDVVQTALQRREKAGEEGLSIDEMQDQLGVGRGDLEQALGVMVDEGVVTLNASDGGLYEFVPPEERGVEDVSHLDADDPDRLEAEAALEYPAPPRAQQPPPGMPPVPPVRHEHTVELTGGPVVRLTKGMLNALSNEAVGEMIKAAVEEHTGDDELTIAIA